MDPNDAMTIPSVFRFVQWLAATPGSIALHESVLLYPLIESVHVWSLTIFVGLAGALDLRLLGVAFRHTPVSEFARRLLPWMIAGFVIMSVSGLLLVYAIPTRTYLNIFFRAKVILLVLAGVNAWVFHAGIWLRVTDWNMAPITPRAAKFAGAASLLLWMMIIFAGRMIAYNWFDCDKQPQSAFVNWAASCQLSPGRQ